MLFLLRHCLHVPTCKRLLAQRVASGSSNGSSCWRGALSLLFHAVQEDGGARAGPAHHRWPGATPGLGSIFPLSSPERLHWARPALLRTPAWTEALSAKRSVPKSQRPAISGHKT
jgi:hypothetical protein